MTILEMRDWFAACAGPLVGLLTFGLVFKAKDKIDTLAISVDGKLAALLASKDREATARVEAATAVGEAAGRAGERSDKNAELSGADNVSNKDLLTAIQDSGSRFTGDKML